MVSIILTFCLYLTPELPNWFIKYWDSSELKDSYSLMLDSNSDIVFVNPDLNGDGKRDVGIGIVNILTGENGLLIIHQKTKETFILGAGTAFGNGGKNWDWVDFIADYAKDNKTEETLFDENYEIVGSKEVKLNQNGIKLGNFEGSSAIIYWIGEEYIWIHQGD